MSSNLPGTFVYIYCIKFLKLYFFYPELLIFTFVISILLIYHAIYHNLKKKCLLIEKLFQGVVSNLKPKLFMASKRNISDIHENNLSKALSKVFGVSTFHAHYVMVPFNWAFIVSLTDGKVYKNGDLVPFQHLLI